MLNHITAKHLMPKLRGRICDFRTFYVFNHVEANKEKVLCPIISFSLPANHLRCLSAPQRAPLCLVTSAVTAGGTSARAGFLARPVLRHVPIRELNLAVTPIKKKTNSCGVLLPDHPPSPRLVVAPKPTAVSKCGAHVFRVLTRR